MERQPRTILLIEDDPASRRLIRAILGARGYNVAEAENVEEARSFLARNIPGLVLLDMRLQGADGLSLVPAIRANPQLRDLPIVAVTAQAMHADERRILEAGCDAYVSKPIDTRRFPRVIDAFMKKGRGALDDVG